MTQSEREAVSKTVQRQIDALRCEMQELQRRINVLQGRDPDRNKCLCGAKSDYKGMDIG